LWSLIDARKAKECYRHAAQRYAAMHHAYAWPLAIASSEDASIDMQLDTLDLSKDSLESVRTVTPQAVAFAILSNEMDRVRARHRSGFPVRSESKIERREDDLRDKMLRFGNVPVGRLGIPFEYYERCARAMRAVEPGPRVSDLDAAAESYVRRASEVIRWAAHDRYHWESLQTAILPGEPEAVAVTVAMATVSHAVRNRGIAIQPELDQHARLLLELGETLYAAGQNPRDEQGGRSV
jgi:hypothetical protein